MFLPLLIFPCTMKSRSSLLAPAHPVGPGKKCRKTVVDVEFFKTKLNVVSSIKIFVCIEVFCQHFSHV